MNPTWVMALTGFAVSALLLFGRRDRKPGENGARPSIVVQGTVQKAIVAEARRQGVDPAVALLFADLETSFRNVRGDSGWPFRRRSDGRTNWEALVRDSSTLADNPYRGRPELWVSYGPFQLLSPFTIASYNPMADPRVLDNVALNVRLGVAKIKRLSDKYGGDVERMRLAYVCGSPGACSSSRRQQILARMETKGERYGIA
jgi:hypothetical protein